MNVDQAIYMPDIERKKNTICAWLYRKYI